MVEACEDLSARRVRVGLVYGNVTAVRWVVRPMLDERLQHLVYNSRPSTEVCSAPPDGIVNVSQRYYRRVARWLITPSPARSQSQWVVPTLSYTVRTSK